jgi:hypothetical protein
LAFVFSPILRTLTSAQGFAQGAACAEHLGIWIKSS